MACETTLNIPFVLVAALQSFELIMLAHVSIAAAQPAYIDIAFTRCSGMWQAYLQQRLAQAVLES